MSVTFIFCFLIAFNFKRTMSNNSELNYLNTVKFQEVDNSRMFTIYFSFINDSKLITKNNLTYQK